MRPPTRCGCWAGSGWPGARAAGRGAGACCWRCRRAVFSPPCRGRGCRQRGCWLPRPCCWRGLPGGGCAAPPNSACSSPSCMSWAPDCGNSWPRPGWRSSSIPAVFWRPAARKRRPGPGWCGWGRRSARYGCCGGRGAPGWSGRPRPWRSWDCSAPSPSRNRPSCRWTKTRWGPGCCWRWCCSSLCWPSGCAASGRWRPRSPGCGRNRPTSGSGITAPCAAPTPTRPSSTTTCTTTSRRSTTAWWKDRWSRPCSIVKICAPRCATSPGRSGPATRPSIA